MLGCLLTQQMLKLYTVSYVYSVVYNSLITVLTLKITSKNTSVKSPAGLLSSYLNHEIHQHDKVQRQ